MLTLWDSGRSLEEYVTSLRKWVEAGSLGTVVAKRFTREQGADAHRFLHEGKNVGKVILTL